jgi:hypothetical protein
LLQGYFVLYGGFHRCNFSENESPKVMNLKGKKPTRNKGFDNFLSS